MTVYNFLKAFLIVFVTIGYGAFAYKKPSSSNDMELLKPLLGDLREKGRISPKLSVSAHWSNVASLKVRELKNASSERTVHVDNLFMTMVLQKRSGVFSKAQTENTLSIFVADRARSFHSKSASVKIRDESIRFYTLKKSPVVQFLFDTTLSLNEMQEDSGDILKTLDLRFFVRHTINIAPMSEVNRHMSRNGMKVKLLDVSDSAFVPLEFDEVRQYHKEEPVLKIAIVPTSLPTSTRTPTQTPSQVPSFSPSYEPHSSPSSTPSIQHTLHPTPKPSNDFSQFPSLIPPFPLNKFLLSVPTVLPTFPIDETILSDGVTYSLSMTPQISPFEPVNNDSVNVITKKFYMTIIFDEQSKRIVFDKISMEWLIGTFLVSDLSNLVQTANVSVKNMQTMEVHGRKAVQFYFSVMFSYLPAAESSSLEELSGIMISHLERIIIHSFRTRMQDFAALVHRRIAYPLLVDVSAERPVPLAYYSAITGRSGAVSPTMIGPDLSHLSPADLSDSPPSSVSFSKEVINQSSEWSSADNISIPENILIPIPSSLWDKKQFKKLHSASSMNPSQYPSPLLTIRLSYFPSTKPNLEPLPMPSNMLNERHNPYPNFDCHDSDSAFFLGLPELNCKWVALDAKFRCNFFIDSFAVHSACKQTCGFCKNSPPLSQYSTTVISPSTALSDVPSINPTSSSDIPSGYPTDPSSKPSVFPSSSPSDVPSDIPSINPSSFPSSMPSDIPSEYPSISFSPTDYCQDDPTVTFLGVEQLNCKWVALDSEERCNFFPDVPFHCQKTCVGCTNPPSSFPSEIPSVFPSAIPTLVPSEIPSSVPTFIPSGFPSSIPSSNPSTIPTKLPTTLPSTTPSKTPSMLPSDFPSSNPSAIPTNMPSLLPSTTPSEIPSFIPSEVPSMIPSNVPSGIPSSLPTDIPSAVPSIIPSELPSTVPSHFPSFVPSGRPSGDPSSKPSVFPSSSPSDVPSDIPSINPSSFPSSMPSDIPSEYPSISFSPTEYCHDDSTVTFLGVGELNCKWVALDPDRRCNFFFRNLGVLTYCKKTCGSCTNPPSSFPSEIPSVFPSDIPTLVPSINPSKAPSLEPSLSPSSHPTTLPSSLPTDKPSRLPSGRPSKLPSLIPSMKPSSSPSVMPSSKPSLVPSKLPSVTPSISPSKDPTIVPSAQPSMIPSGSPTLNPTKYPTSYPSRGPTRQPSLSPSMMPVTRPSFSPSSKPSHSPSENPTYRPSLFPSSHPSNLPSLLPSYKPSLSPSKVPSVMPSDQCHDNKHFIILGIAGLNCGWVTTHPEIKCTIISNGTPVNEICPKTCNNCPEQVPTHAPSSVPNMNPSLLPTRVPSYEPTRRLTFLPTAPPSDVPSLMPSSLPSLLPSSSCYDDKDFRFMGVEHLNCGWIALKPEVKCTILIDGLRVKNVCQKSCNNCPSQLPSETQSGTPTFITEEPSIEPHTRPSNAPSKMVSQITSIISYPPAFQTYKKRRGIPEKKSNFPTLSPTLPTKMYHLNSFLMTIVFAGEWNPQIDYNLVASTVSTKSIISSVMRIEKMKITPIYVGVHDGSIKYVKIGNENGMHFLVDTTMIVKGASEENKDKIKSMTVDKFDEANVQFLNLLKTYRGNMPPIRSVSLSDVAV